jgi:positive regulator of sigma E activity
VDRWISRQGTIVERSGVSVVEFHGGCPGATSGCGTCGGNAVRRLPASLLDLRVGLPGDVVTLRVEAASLNRVAAACFALPLVALLVGAGAGRWFGSTVGFDEDIVSGMMGLGLLVLALAAVARHGDALLRLLGLSAGHARAGRLPAEE